MTNEHDQDQNLESIGESGSNEETAGPMDAVATAVTKSAGDGRLAMLSGGTMFLSTLRSIARGQWRAVPKAAVGAGLLGIGLRQRRSSEASTFEPSTDEIEGETEDKTESDDAHAAREGPDAGRDPQLEGSDRTGEDSQIEFTDDESEPRSKPGFEGEEDPRLTDEGDDEPVEIDVSEPATADEAGEATGPDPEQAQPTQTDATEPEETPEEDASDMKVEPDEGADSESEGDESDAEEADADDET